MLGSPEVGRSEDWLLTDYCLTLCHIFSKNKSCSPRKNSIYRSIEFILLYITRLTVPVLIGKAMWNICFMQVKNYKLLTSANETDSLNPHRILPIITPEETLRNTPSEEPFYNILSSLPAWISKNYCSKCQPCIPYAPRGIYPLLGGKSLEALEWSREINSPPTLLTQENF